MTIQSEVSKAGPFTGNGVQTVFPFEFRVFTGTEVSVYINSILQETGYSVALETVGGSVTLETPLATGSTLAIIRNVAFNQLTDLESGQAFFPDTLERAYDKLTMQTQQLKEGLSRTVIVPPDDTVTDPASLLLSIAEAQAAAAASAASAAASAANIAEAEETCEEYAQQAANMANKGLDNLTDAGKAVIMSYGIPVGIPLPFAGTGDIPAGFLLCNGAAISRTTYAVLYSKIGATYGAGDGTTTFNIPDLRGAFLRGYDGTRSAAIGTAQNDGLPNIQGTIATNPDNEYSAFGEAILSSRTGALNVTTRTQQLISGASSTVTSIAGITFNASNSNSIYGASSYVTPYNYAMNYIIKY